MNGKLEMIGIFGIFEITQRKEKISLESKHNFLEIIPGTIFIVLKARGELLIYF